MFLDTKKVLARVDLQRNYLFEVILPEIEGITSSLDVSAYVQRIKFGGYNLTEIISKKQGPFTGHSAGTIDIETVAMTLLSPADNLVVEYFSNWRDLIVDPSGYYFPKVNYAKTAYCYLYDSAGNQTDAYALVGIFPQTFPSYDLDYSQTGMVKFDVNFSIDLLKRI